MAKWKIGRVSVGVIVLISLAVGCNWFFGWPRAQAQLRPPAGASDGKPVSKATLDVIDQEDRADAEAFSGHQRMSLLPQPGVYCQIDRDASGNIWLLESGNSSAEIFRRSVETAAAGKTHLIRGGHILIVDSAKQYWAVEGAHPHRLLCLSGKGWQTFDEPKAGSKKFVRYADTALELAPGQVLFARVGMNTPSELQLVFPDGHQSVWPLAAGEQPQEDYRAVKLPFGFVALGPTGMPGQYSQGAMQVQQDRVAGKPLQGRKHLPAIFMTDGQASIAFTPTDHPEKEQWVYRAITLPDGSVLTWYEDGTAVLNWPLPANDTMRRRAQTLLA